MPLNFDLSAIEDYESLLNSENEPKKLTETLIWLTMTIGLEKITHQNWQDFYLRVYMYEKLFGTFIHTWDGEKPITPDDVQRHIGLKTNSGSISYTQFLKKLYDRASWDLKQEMKELA